MNKSLKNNFDNTSKAKLLIFIAAFLSFIMSVSIWFNGYREAAIFVGIWVPSICSAGNLLLNRGRK